MTRESFRGIFDAENGVSAIVIPAFQRDYAQGRDDDQAKEIRAEFVRDLCAALILDAPDLGLDFVYGEINGDALVPLDGQQRLTTLFLLHWYVALRADLLRAEDGWTSFTYRTRPSAHHFCRSLIRETADRGDIEPPGKVSEWIADQNWFLYVWKLDPTIRGMLVVLDEIQSQLRSFKPPDFQQAWTRLQPGSDAIWFHFQPLPDMGDEIDLYVKMNSRGKPLTTFENLKAHLEHTLSWNAPLRKDIAKAFDIRWTDLLWEKRQPGEQETLSHQTDELDARMLRFLRFTFDSMAWEAGTYETVSSGRHALMTRVEDLFGPDKGYNSVGYLTSAFDAWAVPDPGAELDDLFCRDGESPDEREQLLVFFESTDLFDA